MSNCRKHHCPIHLSATGALLSNHTHKTPYVPKSYYQDTFHPTDPLGCRPALKIPPTLHYKAPLTVKHDLISVNRLEFIRHPPQTKTASFKPQQSVHSSGARLESCTSYRADYPPHRVEPIVHQPNKALQATVRRKQVSRNNYITTNQQMLRKWSGIHYPPAYGEPPIEPLFQGEFDGETVFQSDFKNGIARLGRPRSSCKKDVSTHVSKAEFCDETTNKMDYTLPRITARGPVHLKKDALKNRETMHPHTGIMESQTQYRHDNPGYGQQFPGKPPLCAPQPDTLQLFTGSQHVLTENKASYNTKQLQNAPRPRTSFKKEQQIHTINDGKFDHLTSFQTHFPPIPLEQLLAQSQVDRQAAAIGHTHKHGTQALDFSEKFTGKTTNRVHFKSWNVTPRIRYGDTCERVYSCSTQPFNGQSETSASFVPMVVKPSTSCKPLETRLRKESSCSSGEVTRTCYADNFLFRPIPHREHCPAELLLS